MSKHDSTNTPLEIEIILCRFVNIASIPIYRLVVKVTLFEYSRITDFVTASSHIGVDAKSSRDMLLLKISQGRRISTNQCTADGGAIGGPTR